MIAMTVSMRSIRFIMTAAIAISCPASAESAIDAIPKKTPRMTKVCRRHLPILRHRAELPAPLCGFRDNRH
jgi:hypothetical protein